MPKLDVALTGDAFIAEQLPATDPELDKISAYLQKYPARVTNLEVVLHDFEQFPSPSSGGTWATARPERLDDLTRLGFNMFSCANNHNLDWLHGGVLSTVRAMEERGLCYAGIGRTLAEASEVAYLPTAQARVALISVTSSFQKWHRAGDSWFDVPGRPGVHALGHKKIHCVSAEQMQMLKAIDANTTINASRNLDLKEGFITSDSEDFALGNELSFRIGEPGTREEIDEKDWLRIKKRIVEAKQQADFVIVSFHSHEFKFPNKDEPADFIREFCHRCIDTGADILMGHGPHILRGIEVYQNKPIFYSLGNFIFQNDLVERQPRDFYELYKLDQSHTLSEALNVRSNHGKRGLSIDQRVWESIIVGIQWQDNAFKIELQPIELGFDSPRARKGRPRLCYDKTAERILCLLQEKSDPFGTSITIDKGVGKLLIKNS